MKRIAFVYGNENCRYIMNKNIDFCYLTENLRNVKFPNTQSIFLWNFSPYQSKLINEIIVPEKFPLLREIHSTILHSQFNCLDFTNNFIDKIENNYICSSLDINKLFSDDIIFDRMMFTDDIKFINYYNLMKIRKEYKEEELICE